MAYGKGGNRDALKRMADLGRIPLSVDLQLLRSKSLQTLHAMAAAVWPADILDPLPAGKELDTAMLRVQAQASKHGFNNVWAEKMRLSAKAAVTEQWKRAQRNLFGRLKHISAAGDVPLEDGTRRLVNLPEEFSRTLDDSDVQSLQELAGGLDFKAAMQMFRDLREGDAGLPERHAGALHAMADVARGRFGIPQWNGEDAVIQLHLDYRCVRGGKRALSAALEVLDVALRAIAPASPQLELSSAAPRGTSIPLALRLVRPVAELLNGPGSEGQKAISLVLEIGPGTAQAKMVVVRPPAAKPVAGHCAIVAEDFGFANTSSLAVLRSAAPVSEERVALAQSRPGKKEAKAFLETHVSGEEVELLEVVQFDGRDFLARIKAHAGRIDRLRAEIDRIYNRMARIRKEMNRVAGIAPDALVPREIPEGMPARLPEALARRYSDMHVRFFRLLGVAQRLKGQRRGVYRMVEGLKKSWFGHIANRKAELAEKHGAAVASEDLTVAAVPVDDPAYKGRTFNKMINNGSKGQYSRRSENTLKWRGIPGIKIPSYWTSSTDWREGTVDKEQRRGQVFRAKSDGRVWDADLHAAEMLGRWLFLRPKAEPSELAA